MADIRDADKITRQCTRGESFGNTADRKKKKSPMELQRTCRGQCVVHEEKNGLLVRQLHSLTDDSHELSHGQVPRHQIPGKRTKRHGQGERLRIVKRHDHASNSLLLIYIWKFATFCLLDNSLQAEGAMRKNDRWTKQQNRRAVPEFCLDTSALFLRLQASVSLLKDKEWVTKTP